MRHYSKDDLSRLPSRYRAHLVNSCTGYRSANLLATKSSAGVTNMAIFNSVMHIGSNPAMLGFVLRPLTVRRDSYDNFKSESFFTVNQVSADILKEAHHTSAKYGQGVSEFSKTGLTEEYIDGFKAPYVKESPIKLGCRYVNEYEIKENGCLLVIGAIEHIYVPKDTLHKDGWVQLDKANTVATIGIDAYALPRLVERFAYAKPDQPTKTLLDDL